MQQQAYLKSALIGDIMTIAENVSGRIIWIDSPELWITLATSSLTNLYLFDLVPGEYSSIVSERAMIR